MRLRGVYFDFVPPDVAPDVAPLQPQVPSSTLIAQATFELYKQVNIHPTNPNVLICKLFNIFMNAPFLSCGPVEFGETTASKISNVGWAIISVKFENETFINSKIAAIVGATVFAINSNTGSHTPNDFANADNKAIFNIIIIVFNMREITSPI